MRDFKPDVILDQLTDLPDDVTQIGALPSVNARIRTEGTQNLIEAARRSWVAEDPGSERRVAAAGRA